MSLTCQIQLLWKCGRVFTPHAAQSSKPAVQYSEIEHVYTEYMWGVPNADITKVGGITTGEIKDRKTNPSRGHKSCSQALVDNLPCDICHGDCDTDTDCQGTADELQTWVGLTRFCACVHLRTRARRS